MKMTIHFNIEFVRYETKYYSTIRIAFNCFYYFYILQKTKFGLMRV